MRTSLRVAALILALSVAAPATAPADGHGGGYGGGNGGRMRAGDLLVSGSVYREADIQPGVTQLPPGCT